MGFLPEPEKMFFAGILSGILAVFLAKFVGYRMHIVLAATIVSSLFCFLATREDNPDTSRNI